jgi:hypothetical protein
MVVALLGPDELQLSIEAVFDAIFRAPTQLSHKKIAIEIGDAFVDEQGVQFA